MAFEPISKEEAIERHRMMWNWIADETLKNKECVDKKDAFEHFGWNVVDALADCWCCRYAMNKKYEYLQSGDPYVYKSKCTYCPLLWPNGVCTEFDGSFFRSYLFEEWMIAESKNNYKKAAKIARKIANLPERKD